MLSLSGWSRYGALCVQAVGELTVGDGGTGGGAAEQEGSEVGDAAAAIEAVAALARCASRMRG